MAFEPRDDWKNLPDKTTPVTAEDLIRIEQGIADASETAEAPIAIGDVTGLQSALDGKQASGSYATQTALAALEARVAALEPEA